MTTLAGRAEVWGGRVVTLGAVAVCPACGRPFYDAVVRSGDVWLACTHRSCRIAAWALAFAPGATVLELGRHFSPPVALAVARALLPAPVSARLSDAQLEHRPLVPPGERAVLLVSATPRERYRLLAADADTIASALGLLSPPAAPDRRHVA